MRIVALALVVTAAVACESSDEPKPAAVVLDEERPYFDLATLPDGRHHRTIGDLFTSLVRAGFRIDPFAEPEPDPPTSLPRTLVLRARKVGI